MPTKTKPRTLEQDVKDFVVETAIERLQKMKTSKFWPKGGFRQGYGYSFKTYGLLEVIPVNALPGAFAEGLKSGRLMINTDAPGTELTRKRFNKVIKLLDGYNTEDISYEYETNCANGHSYWFKWTLNQ